MSLFGDLNEVKLLGNITAEPELRFTNSGTPVANFSVATNRSYKSGEEWKDETEFSNIVLFGKQAQQFVPRVSKGTRVMVSGRLQTRSWEGQDGKKNYRTEIIADDVMLLDRYERGKVDSATEPTGGSQGGNSGSAAAAGAGASSAASSNTGGSGGDDVIDPDDLPF